MCILGNQNENLALNPLDQFELRDYIYIDTPLIGNFHFSITNIGLYLSISIIFILILNLLSTNYDKITSNR